MMSAKSASPERSRGAAEVIARYLRSGDEVTRCLAAKALGKLGDQAAAGALVAALLDEDSDVRSDAMTALLRCARPEYAADIRRSLIGDPVPEVKVAAIRALACLGDRESIPLLRGLARGRFEEQVVWEDEAGMWDEWLDVQLAAVEALGELGASEAIEDLQAARSDEMGQDLDTVVFAALARIPHGGVGALVGSLQDRDPRVRARTLAALAKARPEVLTPMIDLLLEDADAEVRLLAVGCLAPDAPRLADLACHDPDSVLRREALLKCSGDRPEIALAALSDSDEIVRAVALEQLAAHERWPQNDDLTANVLAWMQTAGERLAAVSASVLARLDPEGASAPLLGLAVDADRPIAARVAALRTLEAIDTRGLTEPLTGLAVDSARPVRTATLAALARRCDSATESEERQAAEAAIAQAIRGELCNDVSPEIDLGKDATDAAASKVEDGNARRISITPDGEIVDHEQRPELPDTPLPTDSNVIRGRFPRSTLEAIQAPVDSPPTDSDVALTDGDMSFLELAQKGRGRHRVSVYGPADIAGDIRIVALRVGACSGGPGVEQAISDSLWSPIVSVRIAAFEALTLRALAQPLSPALLPILTNALGDPAPLIRGLAARSLCAASPNAAERLARHLDDPDATVRAEALKAVGGEYFQPRLASLSDPAPLVRHTALQLVLDHGDEDELAQALEICTTEGAVDLIRKACTLSDHARELILLSLSSGNLSVRQTRTVLDAIAETP